MCRSLTEGLKLQAWQGNHVSDFTVKSHHAHVLITRVLMSVRLSLCLWCLQDRWAQQVSVAKRFQCNQPNATPVGWPPLQDSAPLCWGGLMFAAQRSPCAGPRGYEGRCPRAQRQHRGHRQSRCVTACKQLHNGQMNLSTLQAAGDTFPAGQIP